LNRGAVIRSRLGTSPRTPGEMISGWTLVEMVADGNTVYERKWLIECSCGYRVFKWEADLRTSRMTKCITCKANEKEQPCPTIPMTITKTTPQS
jgi:hypothetical protein